MEQLPQELLLMVADNLESQRDINTLCQESRHLHHVLNGSLYKRNAQDHRSDVLLWAALYGRLDAMQTALKYNVNIDTTAVIHESMRSKFLHYFPGWLGPEVIRRNQLTTTPLAMAVAAGHRDLVLFLIQRGATIDCSGCFGLSPLMTAVRVNRIDLVNLLLQNGADCGFRSYWNMNALELAAQKNLKDVVRILLGHGADPNCQSTYPALAWTRNADVMKMLLAYGANPRYLRYKAPPVHLPGHALPQRI